MQKWICPGCRHGLVEATEAKDQKVLERALPKTNRQFTTSAHALTMFFSTSGCGTDVVGTRRQQMRFFLHFGAKARDPLQQVLALHGSKTPLSSLEFARYPDFLLSPLVLGFSAQVHLLGTISMISAVRGSTCTYQTNNEVVRNYAKSMRTEMPAQCCATGMAKQMHKHMLQYVAICCKWNCIICTVGVRKKTTEQLCLLLEAKVPQSHES